MKPGMKRLTVTASFAVLVIAAPAAPARGGVHFRSLSKTDAPQGQAQNIEVEAWVDGDKAKVVFKASNNPMLAAGSYLLTTDGGQTMALVDPDEKTWSPFDVGAMMQSAGAMLKGLGAMVKIEFSNQRVEKLAEEPGPAVLGHPTTHYRFRTSYDSVIKVMGMGQSSHNETTTDTWSTTALSDAGFGAWLRREPPRTGIAGLDELIASEVTKGIQGVPLKVVSATTTRDQRGRENEVTTTMEVTAMKEETVEASTFVIPPGYERTELAIASPDR
jgi:hypothetical protein